MYRLYGVLVGLVLKLPLVIVRLVLFVTWFVTVNRLGCLFGWLLCRCLSSSGVVVLTVMWFVKLCVCRRLSRCCRCVTRFRGRRCRIRWFMNCGLLCRLGVCRLRMSDGLCEKLRGLWLLNCRRVRLSCGMRLCVLLLCPCVNRVIVIRVMLTFLLMNLWRFSRLTCRSCLRWCWRLVWGLWFLRNRTC